MPRSGKKEEIYLTSLATKWEFSSCFQGGSCEDIHKQKPWFFLAHVFLLSKVVDFGKTVHDFQH